MVQFQIVDILSDDIPNSETNGKDFLLTIYGKTKGNLSIVCNVIGFKPYFYMKIPRKWTYQDVSRFFKDDLEGGNIESLLSGYKSYEPKNDLQTLTSKNIVEYKELYGFKCNPDKTEVIYKFVKLEFSSYTAMGKYSEGIRKKYSLLKRKNDTHYDKLFKEWLNIDKDDSCDSHLYESNIHPIIRFIHECNIQPSNWIQIDIDEDEMSCGGLFTNCDLVIDDLYYKDILPLDDDSISPFVIASFDIECDSSHGDFPLPTKDFKKLSIDLYDSMNRCFNKNVPKDTIIIYAKICIQASFDPFINLYEIDTSLDISQVYTNRNKKPSIESIKLFMNIFDNESFIDKLYNPKQRDLVVTHLTNQLNNLTDEQGKLLKVEGDKVIQIGTVFHRYGESEPYKRHILVIAPEDNLPDKDICSPLDNIEVVCCKNEKELLLGWKDIMKTEDPDFVTGYNIFGFDFAYMIDRMQTYCKCNKRYCDKWCPLNKFLNLGKINSLYAYHHRQKKCVEKKIKTNTFGSLDYKRYLHMDGRIIYDLQKEVEKGHNLESYKLDNVAAHFMRGKIKKIISHKTNKITKTLLYTTEFGQLKIGDYISIRLHSNIGETYYKDNQKFKVHKLVSNGESPYLLLNQVYMEFKEEILDKKIVSRWFPDTSEFFKIEWCLMKDDVSPQDIFEKHKSGGPDGRADVAKYCIQDCELCINLTLALDIIPNNIAMANVCSVPQSYIYLRGQGAKIFSLISKVCDCNNIRIPTLKKPREIHSYIKIFNEELHKDKFKLKYRLVQDICKEWSDFDAPEEWEFKDELENDYYDGWKPYKIYDINDWVDEIMNPPPRSGYEGAIVLEPESGIYLNDPVGVVDYASLYPSSIIEKNISHDTLIEDPKYLNYLDTDDYETITYDNYIYEEEEGKVTISKKISEEKPKITCHFLKKQEGKPLGIIPTVVQHLLNQRKATKKRLKNETNDFKKKVLDGLQLSYKLVANSVYGQMGARTSPIYKNILAASTTAIGRERIYDARDGVELGWWKESEWAIANGCRQPKVIYGDTDSVFIKWQRYKNDRLLVGKEALQFCIDCGKDAGEWITKHKLQKPQDLEYEKTFYPFILVSKKRYVADKYEFDINECKRDAMGIVLKRRDNAPIVKHVFGNVIEKIMIDKDLHKSVEWLQQTLQDIKSGQFPMSYFIITKSLRGYYKNPQGIAHKVLADRMRERDPGNYPKAGDRMPYAYIKVDDSPIKTGKFTKVKKRIQSDETYKNGKPKFKTITMNGTEKTKKRTILQGDRVEDPEYITKNILDLDYKFYISNQIMNPVKQVLDLELDSQETEKIFIN